MKKQNYIEVKPAIGKAFFQKQMEGSVVMLNLLKFREVADYSSCEHLKPPTPISGAAAYRLYMHHTHPLLKEAGSEVLFYGKGGSFLIGPAEEDWDIVLLVRHQSVAQFMQFATSEDYLKTAGHRTAALADSRLLPIEEAAI